jgi:hypothetical protein
MRKRIELPIVFHTENSKALDDLGIESDDHQIQTGYFYHIDCVLPRTDEPHRTSVYSGGEIYLCELPIDETLKIIDESH